VEKVKNGLRVVPILEKVKNGLWVVSFFGKSEKWLAGSE